MGNAYNLAKTLNTGVVVCKGWGLRDCACKWKSVVQIEDEEYNQPVPMAAEHGITTEQWMEFVTRFNQDMQRNCPNAALYQMSMFVLLFVCAALVFMFETDAFGALMLIGPLLYAYKQHRVTTVVSDSLAQINADIFEPKGLSASTPPFTSRMCAHRYGGSFIIEFASDTIKTQVHQIRTDGNAVGEGVQLRLVNHTEQDGVVASESSVGGVYASPEAKMEVATVSCPMTSYPGATISFMHNGVVHEVQVPAGVGPGQQFQVQVASREPAGCGGDNIYM